MLREVARTACEEDGPGNTDRIGKANVINAVVVILAALLLSGDAISPGFGQSMTLGARHQLLTPAQQADAAQMGKWEVAARAARSRNEWAEAAAYYRAETQMRNWSPPIWTWLDLGLMLERLGKHAEAYTDFLKGSATNSGRSAWGNDPRYAEALALLGLMCEDRGRHADACACYAASRETTGVEGSPPLPRTIDPQTTSSISARCLLNVALGIALENEMPMEPNDKSLSPACLSAFREAKRLVPNDPAPPWFLADAQRTIDDEAEARRRNPGWYLRHGIVP